MNEKFTLALHSIIKYASQPNSSKKVIKEELKKLKANIQKLSSTKIPLYGHTDEKSAYLVEDYPYGFKLRCRIKFWLEYKPKKGFRFVSQTEDPKRLRWNKPKASTYADWAGNMYLDSQGHVDWEGLGVYSDAGKFLDFVKTYPSSDFKILKYIVPKKIEYLKKMISGEAYWTMNGVKTETTPEDIGRYRKELEIWEDVNNLLH